MKRLGLLLLALFAFLVASCVRPDKPPQSTTSSKASAAQERIYNRAMRNFEEVDLYKVRASSEELPAKLAPLILQEVNSADGKPDPTNGPCALIQTNGIIRTEASLPTIYFDVDSVSLNARAHVLITYIWFTPTLAETGTILAQGVRLTLDSNGAPVLWEVLRKSAGLDLLFVSRKLEAGANAQYGAPLEGRKYSVEGPAVQNVQAVVGRVVEDGPVPMGPMVYLSREDSAVSTVACRCMPVQARSIRTAAEYELVPWSTVQALAMIWKVNESGSGLFSFWPGEPAPRPSLQRLLRLPRPF